MTAGAGWHCSVAGTASQAGKEQHCSCVVRESGVGGAETSLWQGKKATLHALGGIALLSAKCCDVAEPAAVEDTLFFHPGCCIVFIRWSHLGAIHSAPPRCRAMLGICANLPFYEVQSSTKKHEMH